MGVQVSKIPKLVQDKILDYISVTDAVALSRCGYGPDIAVRHNSHFWLKKAKKLHFLDPITFAALDSAPILRLHELRRAVIDADQLLQSAYRRLDARQDFESRKNLESEIILIAVDERVGNIAVQLFNKKTLIYSLQHFDEPPTVIENPHAITDIAIHGDYLFFRPPVDRKFHHTDAMRWTTRDNCPLLSRPRNVHLGPSFGDIEVLRPFPPSPGGSLLCFYPDEKVVNPMYRMRKSSNMLLVHDPIGNELHSYLLASDFFNPSAIRYRLDIHEKLRDHAARENIVLMIVEVDGQFLYRSYNPVAHQVVRQFRVASNIANKQPSINFPYIFIYQVDPVFEVPVGELMNLPCGYRPGRIRHKAFYIPAQCPNVDLRFSVGPSPPRFVPSTRNFFLFFAEQHQWNVEILRADEISRSSEAVSPDPYFDFTDSPVFASLGLSIFYARNNTLVYKRFAIPPRAVRE